MDSFLLYAFAFAFGASIGSFLNVCIYRLPLGFSIVTPPSSCPKCKTPIRPIDNVPLVSYVILRGRCRSCGANIPLRYPLVELLTAIVAVGIVLRFGLVPSALLYFAFAAALIVVTFIDIDHQIIPDAISLPGIGVGLTAAFMFEGTPRPIDAAFGVILGGGILYVVAAGYQWWTGIEGMGLGDVKLLAMIGAFLGWRAIPMCLLIGSLTGSIVGVTAMLATGKGRKLAIPFGPFLSAGALAALFFGEALIEWYLDLLF